MQTAKALARLFRSAGLQDPSPIFYVLRRKKNLVVFSVTCGEKNGSVDQDFFFILFFFQLECIICFSKMEKKLKSAIISVNLVRFEYFVSDCQF